MFKNVQKLGGPVLLALFLITTACSPQKNNNPTQSPTQASTTAQVAATHESHLIELSPFPTSTQEANATSAATTAAGTPASPNANAPTGQPTSVSNSVPTVQASPTTPAASGTQAVAAATTAPAGSSSGGATEKYVRVSQTPLDNIQVRPGVTLAITWTVENTGTTAWTTDYVMRFFSGVSDKDASSIKFPKTVPPNSTVNLAVEIVAPKTTGDYISWWKLTNAQGQNFGDVSLNFTVTTTPKNGVSSTPSS